MSRNEEEALRATLAALGATPAKVRALVEAGRAARGGADAPDVHATLNALLQATDLLGKTAHDLLGHVPEAPHPPAEGAAAPPPDVDTRLARLAFLREHIVSTVAVQGVEVWRRRAGDGRPLQAYAEDLAQADAALLARLRAAVAAFGVSPKRSRQ